LTPELIFAVGGAERMRGRAERTEPRPLQPRKSIVDMSTIHPTNTGIRDGPFTAWMNAILIDDAFVGGIGSRFAGIAEGED
jgi:hypothetical protein